MSQLYVKNPVVNHWHEVETVERPMWHHVKGLQYTASGYGNKLPTRFMVRFEGRLRRVYCKIFSNIGTLYIVVRGEVYPVDTGRGAA